MSDGSCGYVRLWSPMMFGCVRSGGSPVCGAVLLGNAVADRQCNGGLKVVVGCTWWRRVFGECNCRLLQAL